VLPFCDSDIRRVVPSARSCIHGAGWLFLLCCPVEGRVAREKVSQ
jgi:hypothetical protein